MGKKRKHVDIEDVLKRPWCYYCERDFEDMRVLLQHQKAKHFKCAKCYRRLNTAGGLVVHMQQVHKEQLNYIENALPNRSSADIEIFGTEGIPEEAVNSHNQRVVEEFYTAERNRRQATGNPPPGTVFGNAPKKSKLETPEEMKARLAEFKKQKEIERIANRMRGPPPARVLTPSQGGSPFGPFTQSAGPFSGSPPPFSQAQQYPNPGVTQGNQYSAPALPPYAGAPVPLHALQHQNPQAYQPPPFPGQPAPYQQQQQYPPPGGQYPPRNGVPAQNHGLPQRPSFNGSTASAVDDLISSVQSEMDANKAKPAPAPEPVAPKAAEAKPTKAKAKARPARFIYTSETSPEERLASLPQYAFTG